MNLLKKLGVTVAIVAALTLVAPMFAPASQATIVNAATTAKLNKEKVVLLSGKSYTLKVTGIKGTVTWATSNKSVASVTNTGKVTAGRYGVAKVTATIGSTVLTAKVYSLPYKGEVNTFDYGISAKLPKDWYVYDDSNDDVEDYYFGPEEYLPYYVEIACSENWYTDYDYDFMEETIKMGYSEDNIYCSSDAIKSIDSYKQTIKRKGDILTGTTHYTFTDENDYQYEVTDIFVFNGEKTVRINAYSEIGATVKANVHDAAAYMAYTINFVE